MKKTRSTKSALMLSALSLLLCVSMLVGSTFAWFTDSVTANNNIIKSGNLDVELYFATEAPEKDASWSKVTSDTNVFDKTLWEPGKTQVVYFKVVNEGTLALKYNLGVNVVTETQGINQAGDPFKLSSFIEFGLTKATETAFTAAYASREAAREALNGAATKLNVPFTTNGQLLPAEKEKNVHYLAMVVYMPETVGNEANYKTGTNAPEIHLGINLFATQLTNEIDSFGPDYDKGAAWTGAADTAWYEDGKTAFEIDTAEELAGLAKLVNAGNSFEGKTITLKADLDLNDVNWTPIGKSGSTFKGTFIGTGYTIKNLKAIGTEHVGLFGATHVGAHIEGVTVIGAEVSGNDYVGVILGGGYLAANCIKNCTVEDAKVIATPVKLANGNYDGGAKAGVIVGQAYNGNLIDNTAKNSTVIAYRDIGAIAGMLALDGSNRTVEAKGNKVDNVTLSYITIAGTYDDGKTNENMAAVVGRVGNKAEANETENTVISVTTNDKAVMIFTIEELIAFANDVNAGNTYAGKTVILGADIDLNNMEWTPIGTSDAPFKGTFDGNDMTISNLNVNMPGKSNAGLFGFTRDGEIKNLTVENATVVGRLNVGVVAGTPYTSKFTNITVKGTVKVDGMSYVGGVGGKNAYANWTDITVDVKDGSYVKADSVENGSAYRSYVGGVVGFNGEGGHTFKNITSNIDVIGTVCDIGGVFGIAHYGNNFENITCTGDVTNLVSVEIDLDAAADALETGLIAGVWNNGGEDVTFTNAFATGTISAPNVGNVEFPNNGLIGKEYSATGTGKLIITNYNDIDGVTYAIDVVNGGQTLYLVPAEYTASTVTVAEGTDAIGNYAFAYNTNVKTVVLASTVRDLGRGFDSSTVEKVVLNEGLETINSRAFKSTTALKEVVIPSTVTEIADNAFQKSGIKEIVIPASVKTIGETAFGSSSIEKVTFEGDTAIQGYAFRGCPNLRTVVLNGYNVTFVPSTLSGRNSMWFCNGESNNPNTSNITFYVKNDVIKERVLTAMGAERNNTPVVVEKTVVSVDSTTTTDAFVNLLQNSNGTVISLTENFTLGTADRTKITVNGDVYIYADADTTLSIPETTIFTGEGKITVLGGKIVANHELCVSGNTTLVIDGGEHTFGAFSATGNGTIIVNDGVLNCKGSYAGVMGISFGETGKLYVNGGTLNMYQPFNLNANRCDKAYIEINGGKIELLNNIENLFVVRNVMDKDKESGVLRGSSVKITDGTFIAHYEIDSAGDATSFIRNGDPTSDTNRVLVSDEKDGYKCVVTGGTFYGSWQRADNTRYENSDGLMVDNSIAGFVATGYQISGDPVNGYVVSAN